MKWTNCCNAGTDPRDTGVENFGGFLPRQASGPPGEEDLIGDCIRALALVPRHGLNSGRTRHRTDYAARGVVQEHRNAPERHELPLALGAAVMDASRQFAAGTATLEARIKIQVDVDALRGAFQAMADGFDDKTGKALHVTEERFKCRLNGGGGVSCCLATPSNSRCRHSQTQKVLPRKTHTSLFARLAAAVKRADDINHRRTTQAWNNAGFMPSARLTAARSGHRTPPTTRLHDRILHTNSAEEPKIIRASTIEGPHGKRPPIHYRSWKNTSNSTRFYPAVIQL